MKHLMVLYFYFIVAVIGERAGWLEADELGEEAVEFLRE